MTDSRRHLAPSILVTLLLLAPGAAAAPRVIVIGFDGADAELTRQYLAEGRLPHLASLAQEGAYRPLLPTNPPQTPVSWSTFATGLNPGRTEIFDFLKRTPGRYEPAFCAFDETHRKPFFLGERNALAFAFAGAGVGLVPLLFLAALRWRGRREDDEPESGPDGGTDGGAAGGSGRGRSGRGLLVLGLGLVAAGAAAGGVFGSRLLPRTVPDPINNRKGETFWELASRAGLRTRVLRVPLTFPADQHAGLEMISGLGVPDLRGLVGQPTLYTTRRGLSGGQFSISCLVVDASGGPIDTVIEGPRNIVFPERQWDVEPAPVERCNPSEGQGLPPRTWVPLRLTPLDGGAVRIEAGGTTSEVPAGGWSGWHHLEFSFNPVVKLRGMTRFYNQARPGEGGTSGVDLVMSPIQFHPEGQGGVRWCHPPEYGPDLARDIGPFKTQGWAIDTWTVSEGLSSETHSLEDAIDTAERYEEVMAHELANGDADLFVQVFSFTDRIQHVFLRLADPTHPAYDAELAEKHRDVVRECYERMDRIVGRARELAPPDALFVVLSDHGFAQFRRGVNTNRWLINHGFLVLKDDPCSRGQSGGRTLDDLFEDKSRTFGDVDWSRTKAFALGLGNVYVNLAGREPEGIVRPGAEYREVVARIQREMEALVDPATGERPIAKVHHRDEMYRDYDPALIPDLRVANAPGYRVSWDTSLGGAPCEEIQDNAKAWGADHCSLEPALVKGILFANRPVRLADPQMADLAPSLLAALGLEAPPGADGRQLF